MKNPGKYNTQIYGATILMRNLSALMQEIDGVLAAEDIEYVHRMRVATRRLRSALPLFGPLVAAKRHEAWRKEISGITRALGEARDTDVQIEHIADFVEKLSRPERAGVRRLLLRLRQRRNNLQADVIKAVNKFQKSSLAVEMAQKLAPLDIYKDTVNLGEPHLVGLAGKNIQEKLNYFLSYESHIYDPENITELHAMRIAAKRLRYTVEFFTPLYENELKPTLKVLRASQDLLGEIHDCDVWIAALPQFIDEERQRTVEYFGSIRPFKRLEPGLVYYQQVQHEERQSLYDQFIRSWNEWQQQGVWAELSATLQQALEKATAQPVEKLETIETDDSESPPAPQEPAVG